MSAAAITNPSVGDAPSVEVDDGTLGRLRRLNIIAGVLHLVSALAMTVLFVSLSNKVIERGLKKRRPGYEDYVQRTSALFPLPPKKRDGSHDPNAEHGYRPFAEGGTGGAKRVLVYKTGCPGPRG